jgi:hypothetical protein
MKFAVAFALLASTPAFAQNVYCVNSRDNDKIVELVVDNGQVRGATYTNQSNGSLDDRPLQPGEYSYNGSSLSFQGEIYSCQ